MLFAGEKEVVNVRDWANNWTMLGKWFFVSNYINIIFYFKYFKLYYISINIILYQASG